MVPWLFFLLFTLFFLPLLLSDLLSDLFSDSAATSVFAFTPLFLPAIAELGPSYSRVPDDDLYFRRLLYIISYSS